METACNSLEILFARHTDKVSDKWLAYLAEYTRVLDPYRNQPVRLLEIGVQNGGSLEIWAKYFPHAQAIVGCDINLNCSSLRYSDPRIKVVVENANSDAAQAKILASTPAFEIIIDDGSHRSSDIIRSFARYFPCLTDGGIYVAEDLHCSYWQESEGGLFSPHSSMAFFKRLVDIVNREHWGIEKGSADILKGFSRTYDIAFDLETLDHIHAVEFTNSMCVIRKDSARANKLGKRVVAGSIAEIHPGLLALRGTEVSQTPEAIDQSSNPWTAREMPPDEELLIRIAEINELKERVTQLERTLADKRDQIEGYGKKEPMLAKTIRLLHQFKPGEYVADNVTCYDDNELQELGQTLANLIYAPSKLRRALQNYGATITRADFYSEIPLIKDLEESFRSPSRLKLDEPFGDSSFLKKFLVELTQFSIDFNPPATSEQEGQFAWNNGSFSFSDAMSYYAMIRRYRPETVVELGCGASTLVASLACERNGVGRIIAFEACPASYLRSIPRVQLIEKRAQDIDEEQLNGLIKNGDFLFLDTTHTVKHESDCLHVYLRLLPFIRSQVFVHVHDINLPLSLPIEMMRDTQIFWNEQYLLYAYMLGNPRVKTLFGSAYHHLVNHELLESFMHRRYTAGGRSFWFSQMAQSRRSIVDRGPVAAIMRRLFGAVVP